MRWPFRRRAGESAVNAEPGAAKTGGAAAFGAPGAVERPQPREWSALPPLPGTFGAKAPLVIGPAPVLPPLPGRREPMPASDPVLKGSVQGIASVIKPVRFDREAADVVHRPVRRRAVVVTPIEPMPLTYVDDQHVEEPREPKVPHRAPAWLRYTPPAWMTQQNEEPGGLPDLGLPLPIMETPPPPPAPVVRPNPQRRANLGQSRRLGLGAPISSTAQQFSEEDPAPEEPAPAAPPLIHEPVSQESPEIHEPVPAELATAMRQTHQIDVADVPVVRGPNVTAEARSHGARAFTRAGKVHLPDEAGPLTSPKARGLIAHELVHAVQQRTLGLSLPSPSSEHGQALEAEAVAAERFYAGEAPEPPPLIHAPRPTPSFAADTHTQLAPTTVPTTSGPTTSAPPQQVIDTRVREEVDRVATDTARRVVQQEWQNPSLTPQQRQALGLPAQGQQQQSPSQQQQQQEDQPDPTAGYLEAAVLSRLRPSAARHAPPSTAPQTAQSSQGPLPQTTAATVQPQSHQATQQQQQQPDQDAPADSTAGYLEAAVLGRLSHNGHHLHRETSPQQQQPQQTTDQHSQSPQSPAAAHTTDHVTTTAATTTHHQVDINDLDLEELSARLYTRLRSRLRLELLVDRERAGQLSDYR